MDTFTSLLAGTCMFMLLGYLDLNNENRMKNTNKDEEKKGLPKANWTKTYTDVAKLSESQGAGMVRSFMVLF